jgi:hypothetical protein
MHEPGRGECLRNAEAWTRRWATAEACYFRRLLVAARTSCPRECDRVMWADDAANEFKGLAAGWLALLSASGMDATARDLCREAADRLAGERFATCDDLGRPVEVALAIPLASEERPWAIPGPGVN